MNGRRKPRRAKKRLEGRKILGASIDIVKERREIFVPVAFMIVLNLLMDVYNLYMAPNALASPLSGGLTLQFFVVLIVWVVQLFLAAILIRTVHDSGKRNFSFDNAVKVASSRLVSLIISTILVMAFAFIGVILLALPFVLFALISPILSFIYIFVFLAVLIYAAIRISYYQFAIVIDGEGAAESIVFSWKMTKGHVFKIFLISAMVGLIALAVMIPLIIVSVIGTVFIFPNNTLLMQTILSIGSFFIVPFSTAVNLLIYLRLRK